MKARLIWQAIARHYTKHYGRYRIAIEAAQLLVVVYLSMFLWGVVAELTGQEASSLVWPGLLTTLFCVYVLGRFHNVRRSRRIKKLYDRVKAEEGPLTAKGTESNQP